MKLTTILPLCLVAALASCESMQGLAEIGEKYGLEEGTSEAVADAGKALSLVSDLKQFGWDTSREEPSSADPASYTTIEIQDRAVAEAHLEQAMAAEEIAVSELHLLRSLAFSPSPRAYNNLGVIAQHVNEDVASARAFYRKALALDPTYTKARENLDKL